LVGPLPISRKFHNRVQWALKSWWERDYDPIVEVLTDTDNPIATATDNTTFIIPNVFNTSCPNTYNYGLWCKNLWMLKRWRDDPKFKDVKWFYRGMDDSWMHMENLVWLARQYDHTKPMAIGERVCDFSNADYPDGGPGFLISRGVIDHPNYYEGWKKALELNKPHGVYDDLIWGLYMRVNNITMIHYHGISHTALYEGSQLYRYYARQKDHDWPLAFRPVAYHQSGKTLQLMPEVHKTMWSVDYGRVVTNPYVPPNCNCVKNVHRKCTWNETLNASGPCTWSSGELKCIGPGPWPNSEPPPTKTS
jgi:hypothetical protein